MKPRSAVGIIKLVPPSSMPADDLTFAEDSIGVAGAGRVAQALGRLLAERGEPVMAVASRDPERAAAAALFIGGAEPVSLTALARCERVLIAVPDDAIPAVAEVLAGAGMQRGAVLHTSGARGPEVLAALAAAGVSCGALHPLQTIATPEQGLGVLTGGVFAISGAGAARAWAERIVTLLGGTPLPIPPERYPLYHAAAVMASNHLVGLVDAAVKVMELAGIAPEEALRALAPLASSSLANALALGPAQALTGPLGRGDAGTIALHLEALRRAPEPVRALYRVAARHLVDLARRKGMPEAAARRLEEILEQGAILN